MTWLQNRLYCIRLGLWLVSIWQKLQLFVPLNKVGQGQGRFIFGLKKDVNAPLGRFVEIKYKKKRKKQTGHDVTWQQNRLYCIRLGLRSMWQKLQLFLSLKKVWHWLTHSQSLDCEKRRKCPSHPQKSGTGLSLLDRTELDKLSRDIIDDEDIFVFFRWRERATVPLFWIRQKITIFVPPTSIPVPVQCMSNTVQYSIFFVMCCVTNDAYHFSRWLAFSAIV